MTKKYNIHVCQFPGGNSTHPDVGDWLAETLYKMKTDERIGQIKRFKKSDTPITMVRNLAVKVALAEGADYILMIDSDMGPDYLVGQDPQARPFWEVAWGFMMKRRLEEFAAQFRHDEAGVVPPATIAAPYCGPPPLELPYIFRWKNRQSDHPDPDFYLECMERSDAAMRSGIEEVAALPTGLILYDVRVFKALEEAKALPWFEYEYEDPPYNTRKVTTEDVWQTRNSTLLEPSLPLYVAWDCWAIHYKTKAVKKPLPVTQAAVKGVMREALASKYEDHNERIHFVHRHDPVVGAAGEAPPAAKPEAGAAEAVRAVALASNGGLVLGVSERLPAVGLGGSDHAGDAGRREGREHAYMANDPGDRGPFGYK